MNRPSPDNAGARAALAVAPEERQADEAEAVLRAAAADPAVPGPALTVAQFLLEVKGPEAARAELVARAAAAGAEPGKAPYVRGSPASTSPRATATRRSPRCG